MKNSKYILIVLLLIIISTAGYAGWDYYNTKKIEQERIVQEELKQEDNQEELTEDQLRYRSEVEPKNWDVLESEEYGFRIKYPRSLDMQNVKNSFYFRPDSGGIITIAFVGDITLKHLVGNYMIHERFQPEVEYINEGRIRMLNNNDNIYAYMIQKGEGVYVIKSNPPKEDDYEVVITEDNETFAEVFEKMYKSLEFMD